MILLAAATLDDLNKVVQTVAVILGGIGVYIKWFRGRTYKPRLETAVSGRVSFEQGLAYLTVAATLKNVGLSQIVIEQEKGTGLRVSRARPAADYTEARSAVWEHLASFPIFKDHGWIEAGETIKDQRLIVIPAADPVSPYLVELWIAGEGLLWKTIAIVGRDAPAGPEKS